ncbi:MAG TPA: DUF1697 domain-containing protein [Acidimicrobiales bacterium]|nr:DUF1697 domain-containing protein [Acidimicrobiales bacterium]
MTTWVALLGSVNVGTRRVKMPRLIELFTEAGAVRPETYVQSGNVVFEHESNDAAVLTADLEAALGVGCGFDVAVYLRTGAQLDAIVTACPFDEDDPKRLSAVFLVAEPDAVAVEAVAALAMGGEEMAVSGTTAYLHLPFGTGRSKLAAGVRKLGAGTARNWRSVTTLRDLALARD